MLEYIEPELVIPDTEVKLRDCELDSVRRAVGGNLIIKHLPFYPPIDCGQDKCYELAEYVVMLVSSDKDSDTITTLCKGHLDMLLILQELQIPIEIRH